MDGLTYPDLHHALAAEGWLELRAPAEARLEVDKLSTPARELPEIQDLECRIASMVPDWLAVVTISNRMVATSPWYVGGWIHRSFGLHELRRTQEAFQCLLEAEPNFPGTSIIPYNLACYACQLGDLTEARRWLKRASELKGIEQLQELALGDPDLAPLREEIASW